MEFKFFTWTEKGQPIRFTLNDSQINYMALRTHLLESTCIEAISHVKKHSGKKCALVFGNCQTMQLQKIFQRHIQFRNEYFILELPAACNYGEWMIDLIFGGGGQFLQLVDLFISQHVKETNRFGGKIATKNISDKLREDTKILWIPNIYFDGYFPQFKHNDRNIVDGAEPTGRFPHGDRFIDEIMESSSLNPDVEKILDKISAPDFLSPDEIRNHTERSFEELHRREWICDIRISDYVEANVFGKQIFYSTNHPFTFVLLELARRILQTIDMTSDIFIGNHNLLNEEDWNVCLIGQDIPIYPCVKNFFKFEESLDRFWANYLTWNFRAGFRDFLREYIRQCWAEKFKR